MKLDCKVKQVKPVRIKGLRCNLIPTERISVLKFFFSVLDLIKCSIRFL